MVAALHVDHVTAFRDAMAKKGINYSGPIEPDGRFHRVAGDDDRKGKRNVWYKLVIDERPAGMFGSNKLGNDTKFTWTAKGLAPLSPEERAEIARVSAEARAKRLAEETALHEKAKGIASAVWDGAQPASTHPYLTKKRVPSYGLRVGDWTKKRKDGTTYVAAKSALLIPLYSEGKRLWSLQAIFAEPALVAGEERGKDFVYGGRKQGLYCPIGKPCAGPDGRVTIIFAEGYATGATVHLATGMATVVCFDAGNLIHVARMFRRLMPDARLVFAADNDQWTMVRGQPDNVGVRKATEAAQTVKGEVIAPRFENIDNKPTDWNDLHVDVGIEEVKRQLSAALVPPVSPNPDNARSSKPMVSAEHRGNEASAPLGGATWPSTIRVDGRGLHWHNDSAGEGEWLCAPIEVVGLARDADNQQWGRVVRFKDDDGCEKTLFISAATLVRTPADVIAQLADAGFRFSTARPRTQLERLAGALNAVRSDRRVTITRSSGWIGGSFVYPGGVVAGPGGEAVEYVGERRARFSQAGTLGDWQNSVGVLASGNEVAQLAVALPCPGRS